jgi:hypothetical protein
LLQKTKTKQNQTSKPGVMVYDYNPSTWEAEAVGWRVPDQPDPHSKTLSGGREGGKEEDHTSLIQTSISDLCSWRKNLSVKYIMCEQNDSGACQVVRIPIISWHKEKNNNPALEYKYQEKKKFVLFTIIQEVQNKYVLNE